MFHLRNEYVKFHFILCVSASHLYQCAALFECRERTNRINSPQNAVAAWMERVHLSMELVLAQRVPGSSPLRDEVASNCDGDTRFWRKRHIVCTFFVARHVWCICSFGSRVRAETALMHAHNEWAHIWFIELYSKLYTCLPFYILFTFASQIGKPYRAGCILNVSSPLGILFMFIRSNDASTHFSNGKLAQLHINSPEK